MFRALVSAAIAVGALAPTVAGCAGSGGARQERFSRTVVNAVYIHAPYDTVWGAITKPERHAEWFSAPCVKFGGAGDTIVWGSESQPLISGRALWAEKGKGLAHTFTFEFLRDGSGKAPLEPDTSVRWRIEAHGDVTFVEITHDFSDAPQSFGVIGEYGWEKSLNRLKTLLETGKAMPWPKDPEPAKS